ncbi:hypothetical protein L596_022061 [Steinernema carpocapsae]|uniref:Uncharacterized protein n=1 Tax=Steinernema carpocapsae TaxID=34508 RepID=A0A4U5MKZ3_STECR|nr:hypothetical protein L596_022061 [Steinernema carpocapsae]
MSFQFIKSWQTFSIVEYAKFYDDFVQKSHIIRFQFVCTTEFKNARNRCPFGVCDSDFDAVTVLLSQRHCVWKFRDAHTDASGSFSYA